MSRRLLSLILVVMWLVACGGEGSTPTPTADVPAVDQAVTDAAGMDVATSDATTTADAPPVDASVTSQLVGPAGATLTAPGLRVVIPAGALRVDTPIAVGRASAGRLPPGAVAVSPVFELNPTGTTFTAPVVLTADVDRALVGAGPFRRGDSLAMLHAPATADTWSLVGADAPQATTVTGRTRSFSRFVVVLIRASECFAPDTACSLVECASGRPNEYCGQRCAVASILGTTTHSVTCSTATTADTVVRCICDAFGTQRALPEFDVDTFTPGTLGLLFATLAYRSLCDFPCLPPPEMDAGTPVDAGVGPCTELPQSATMITEHPEGFDRPPWTVRATPPDGTWTVIDRGVNIMTATAGTTRITVRLSTVGGAREIERTETRTAGGTTETRTLRGAIRFTTPVTGDSTYEITPSCDTAGATALRGEFRYDAAANQILWRWNPLGYGFGETLQREGTTALDAGTDIGSMDVPSTCTFPTQRSTGVRGTLLVSAPENCRLMGGAIPAGTYVVTRYAATYSSVDAYDYLKTYQVSAPRVVGGTMVQDIGLIEASRHRASGMLLATTTAAGQLTTSLTYPSVFCSLSDGGVMGPMSRPIAARVDWRCPTESTMNLLYDVSGSTVEVDVLVRGGWEYGETWTLQ